MIVERIWAANELRNYHYLVACATAFRGAHCGTLCGFHAVRNTDSLTPSSACTLCSRGQYSSMRSSIGPSGVCTS